METIEIKQELLEAANLLHDGKNIIGSIEYRKDNKNSDAVVNIVGVRNISGQEINRETIFSICSISKEGTVAALCKLWDDELNQAKENKREAKWFPNGLDTKLSHFMPSLRDQYPQCSAMFDLIAKDEHFDEISLRDLLNHSHGLGAKNDSKIRELIRASGGKLLSLSDIINLTERREKEVYGDYKYGNFGYDLAAMIIEIISGKSFDAAKKELVFEPLGMRHTYTQSDYLRLCEECDPVSLNAAIGYFVDSKTGQELRNSPPDTRGGGGDKSSVEDLAVFAASFISGEMFENEEVKSEILAQNKGARMDATRTYHLAMNNAQDGTRGHPGESPTFLSNLRYNQKTGAVFVKFSVAENLTSFVVKKIFNEKYLGDKEKLENIFKSVNLSPRHNPQRNEELKKLLQNAETRDLIERYNEIMREVLSKNPANTVAAADARKVEEKNNLQSKL